MSEWWDIYLPSRLQLLLPPSVLWFRMLLMMIVVVWSVESMAAPSHQVCAFRKNPASIHKQTHVCMLECMMHV